MVTQGWTWVAPGIAKRNIRNRCNRRLFYLYARSSSGPFRSVARLGRLDAALRQVRAISPSHAVRWRGLHGSDDTFRGALRRGRRPSGKPPGPRPSPKAVADQSTLRQAQHRGHCNACSLTSASRSVRSTAMADKAPQAALARSAGRRSCLPRPARRICSARWRKRQANTAAPAGYSVCNNTDSAVLGRHRPEAEQRSGFRAAGGRCRRPAAPKRSPSRSRPTGFFCWPNCTATTPLRVGA